MDEICNIQSFWKGEGEVIYANSEQYVNNVDRIETIRHSSLSFAHESNADRGRFNR